MCHARWPEGQNKQNIAAHSATPCRDAAKILFGSPLNLRKRYGHKLQVLRSIHSPRYRMSTVKKLDCSNICVYLVKNPSPPQLVDLKAHLLDSAVTYMYPIKPSATFWFFPLADSIYWTAAEKLQNTTAFGFEVERVMRQLCQCPLCWNWV